MPLQIDEGDERIMRVVGAGLKKLGLNVVQHSVLFEPTEDQIPLVRMAWRDPYESAEGRPEHPSYVTLAPTILSFPPKFQGEHDGAEGETLRDESVDFAYALAPAAIGDVVRNLRTAQRGTVTGLGADNHEIVCSIEFEHEDGFEIHWPFDAIDHYNDSHTSRLVLDLYAATDASFESGLPMEKLHKLIRDYVWIVGREELNAVGVDIVEYEKTSNQGGIIGSGLESDFYERLVTELVLFTSGSMDVRRPTIERIVNRGASNDEGGCVG